ncbi:MAG: hypothetical protein L0Z62_26285 [Gemmataceae bacterium]|nr:hypothetical protein [Gemmataceae bacterium]
MSTTPEQVRLAWQHLFSQPMAPDHGRWLGLLLDGLPLIAAGRVAENGRALPLVSVVTTLSAHEPAATWQTPDGRPFLVELARRILALGCLDSAYPQEDPLLNPMRTHIDPVCADPELAFARAVGAVELQNAHLLGTVVARHLARRTGEGEALRGWIEPLLDDGTAQCLLTGALAQGWTGPGQEEAAWLWRGLLRQYEEAPMAWPAGPLTTACALGRLLSRPTEACLVSELRDHVTGWPGWQDESAWPTRHPGETLAELQALLTERAALALGVADRKLWPRAGLEPLLAGCWAPLLSFCF